MENDGEVTCLTDGTKLNRSDKNCWRCGSTKLSTLAVTAGPDLILKQYFKIQDGHGDEFAFCLCPRHWAQSSGAPRPIHPSMAGWGCMATFPNAGYCKAQIVNGWWKWEDE